MDHIQMVLMNEIIKTKHREWWG